MSRDAILQTLTKMGGHLMISGGILPTGRTDTTERSSGRIDGMVTLLNALAVAPLRTAVKFDVEALIA